MSMVFVPTLTWCLIMYMSRLSHSLSLSQMNLNSTTRDLIDGFAAWLQNKFIWAPSEHSEVRARGLHNIVLSNKGVFTKTLPRELAFNLIQSTFCQRIAVNLCVFDYCCLIWECFDSALAFILTHMMKFLQWQS
jgi:hypothetical protein